MLSDGPKLLFGLFVMILVVTFLIALMGWIITLCWAVAVVPIFGLAPITILQAIAFQLLVYLVIWLPLGGFFFLKVA